MKKILSLILFILPLCVSAQTWNSVWVYQGSNGKLVYKKDAQGNSIPDFSMVGYKGGCATIPTATVKATVSPVAGDDGATIQAAIDQVSKLTPGADGLRGAVLLKKGNYEVAKSLNIKTSGVVLLGEGQDAAGTVITFTATTQSDFVIVQGSGSITEVSGTRKAISDSYVPVGAKSFKIANTTGLAVGDKIIVHRAKSDQWIHDIGMDAIPNLQPGDKNWTAFDLYYEREIVAINASTNIVTINAPVVCAIETKYGGGDIYKYTYNGRINNIGVENIRFDSKYTSDTDENHGWKAIRMDDVEDCWVRNVTSLHYGYSCVSLEGGAKSVSVLNSSCLDPISQITGGRRYSFNCTGQLNLFKGCTTRGGRHDFVTGAHTNGPNVFTNCTATQTHADAGPHHRWASGTLYDKITCGQINVQDRGNMGSGHGWAGANQVLWNCKGSSAVCQVPPTANNWNIGFQGNKGKGYLPRPDGIWEGQNKAGLAIESLYEAQLNERCNGVTNVAPTVSITSPANNASFTAPAAITINANASDADGTISKVEFFNGTTKLGEDATSPYSFAWSNVAAGTYSITAKATDNKGATATSAIITVTVTSASNVAPTLSITSPSNNASFTAPANITINANASDADGTVSKVEFFNGSTKLGEDATSPYSFAWNNVAVGTYTITAKATDNKGATTTSAIITLTVVSITNVAPTVSVTSPSNNASFTAPASITINANASDADGTVSKVEFFNGSTKLGEDATSPYSFAWNNVAAGTYTITAKATDNKGAVNTSSVVTIIVKANTNTCSGATQYVENGGYVDGSKVQNAGSLYQCKPYPYTGWCNGASWAYAPGTGMYWQDAWTLVGPCSSARIVSGTSASDTELISNSPNPFGNSTMITVKVETAGETSVIVYDKLGREVAVFVNAYLTADTYNYNFDASNLPADLYTCRLINNGKITSFKIVKQ